MPKINRPHSIVVKVTADERDAITRLALKEKLTAANWLRSLGMSEIMEESLPTLQSLKGMCDTDPTASGQDYAPGEAPGKPTMLEQLAEHNLIPSELVKGSSKPTFKNGDLVAPVPKEWGTLQPADDAPGKDLSLPENGSIAHRQTAPKPQSGEERIYKVIMNRDGKAKADAWLAGRKKPSPVVIGEPQVPQHLRAFYDSLVKNQGQAQADFWLLTNTKGVKLAP